MAETEVKQQHRPGRPKRLIICCDGTWQDSLGKRGTDPPTNVTRISRILRRNCSDGTPQIVTYFPGVGSGNLVDKFTGGVFGSGLDQDIREVYNFICTNYVDGDDIVLIGFSRGAFTARSVADMIASVGLLTPSGMEHFYAVFEDYEEIRNTHRDAGIYLVPGLPKYGGEKGKAKNLWEDQRSEMYKQGLKKIGYTRDTYKDGVTGIKIKAIGVWDTVGTLGVPPAPVFGINGSADQFTNTQVSDKVENAFQALALDEPRSSFRPALWERINGNKTNLRQVWFPGTHSNVGGGWPDQQIANITLAWMCDQLSSIGVEFNLSRVKTVFLEGLRYSAAHPFPYALSKKLRLPSSISELCGTRPLTPWAAAPIFQQQSPSSKGAPPRRDAADCDGTDQHPSGSPSELQTRFAPRPWSLGQTRYPTNALLLLAGTAARTPGRAVRVDSDTNADIKNEPLLRTGERIHSSVRVRLACSGLGTDDGEVWRCEPLTGSSRPGDAGRLWRLERGSGFAAGEGDTPKPRELARSDCPESLLYPVEEGDSEWRWVFSTKPEGAGDAQIPRVTMLPEEPMVGYWERYLLALTTGTSDVWRWAQQNGSVSNGKASG